MVGLVGEQGGVLPLGAQLLLLGGGVSAQQKLLIEPIAAKVRASVMPAYAAGDPLTVVNNLSTFIFGLIRAVGLILLGWGFGQVGLSLQSHVPSQRSNGFLSLAGGIVITFAKEILDLIIA